MSARASTPNSDTAVVVVRPRGPRWLHAIVIGLGLVFLISVFLNSSGSSLPRQVLPRSALFFSQIACLFPKAAVFAIEYRAEAYSCSKRQFVPFDHRPYFPMHSEDKESRFHRVAHFYRRDAKVMKSLETHLLTSHNATLANNRGPAESPIGGIRLLSLRIPFPEPGEQVERYHFDPTRPVPREWRKPWYMTPTARRAAHCEENAK